MRELLRAAVTGKPIIAMLEPEAKHGGLTEEEIRQQLSDADLPCEKQGTKFRNMYEMWGLRDEVHSWGYKMPSADDLCQALFASDLIEWARIGAFQDVTLRLVAERLVDISQGISSARQTCAQRTRTLVKQRTRNLIRSASSAALPSNLIRSASSAALPTPQPNETDEGTKADSTTKRCADWPRLPRCQTVKLFGRTGNEIAATKSTAGLNEEKAAPPLRSSSGSTYMQGELASSKVTLTSPHRLYHVYCSPHNEGAKDLMHEAATVHGVEVQDQGQRNSATTLLQHARKSGVASLRRPGSRRQVEQAKLVITTNSDELARCDHMLIYLTSHTWSNGETKAALAADVRKAMTSDVCLLLAHEMTGVEQAARGGCEFGLFFEFETTPPELIMAGIYSSIAIPLKGGPWRSASMIMIAKALTADLILPSQMNSSQSASSTRQVRTRAERARTLVRQQTRTLVRAVSRAKMVMPKPREQTKWKLGSVKKTKQRSIWATSLSTKHEVRLSTT